MEEDGRCQLNPLNEEDGVVLGQEKDDGGDADEVGALKQKVKDLEEILVEHWEYNHKDGEKPTPTLTVPTKPTEAERVEHEVTHTPPRPWCRYCMMGRGVRRAPQEKCPGHRTR